TGALMALMAFACASCCNNLLGPRGGIKRRKTCGTGVHDSSAVSIDLGVMPLIPHLQMLFVNCQSSRKNLAGPSSTPKSFIESGATSRRFSIDDVAKPGPDWNAKSSLRAICDFYGQAEFRGLSKQRLSGWPALFEHNRSHLAQQHIIDERRSNLNR